MDYILQATAASVKAMGIFLLALIRQDWASSLRTKHLSTRWEFHERRDGGQIVCDPKLESELKVAARATD